MSSGGGRDPSDSGTLMSYTSKVKALDTSTLGITLPKLDTIKMAVLSSKFFSSYFYLLDINTNGSLLIYFSYSVRCLFTLLVASLLKAKVSESYVISFVLFRFAFVACAWGSFVGKLITYIFLI